MPAFLLIWNLSKACRGLNFISIKTRVSTNQYHVRIQGSHIKPCCDKCDKPHIKAKSWPLIGQKRTTIIESEAWYCGSTLILLKTANRTQQNTNIILLLVVKCDIMLGISHGLNPFQQIRAQCAQPGNLIKLEVFSLA